MGLVSTWLRGIGLSNAIPTFEAAGIVTPAALAELDVTHFAALGISDADDRRKLFYLVQRIKMAVQKESTEKQHHSVEEQVDAVLSGAPARSDDEKKEDKPIPDAPVARRHNLSTPPASPSISATKNNSPPKRRSKRLASKQQRDPGSPSSSAKENRSPAKSRPTTRDSPRNGQGKQSLEDDLNELLIDDEENTEDQKNDDSDWEDEAGKATTRRLSSRRLGLRRASKADANRVFNLAEDGDGTEDGDVEDYSEEPQATDTTDLQSKSHQKTSGLKTPKQAKTPTSNTDAQSNGLQTPSNKSSASANRRPESKLQNPGKSMRTGKQLSAIPSESEAPMSPLFAMPPGTPKQEGSAAEPKSKTTATGRHPKHHRRHSSGSSIDRLLQSSVSDLDSVGSDAVSNADSENESHSSQPKNVRKSTGASLPRNNLGRPGRQRRASSNAELGSTQKPAITPRSESMRSSSTSSFTVQGVTEKESFATKIAHLREDNDAEHELFRDEADQQLYDYDMRIRVIVRKRPVSNAERTASGGVDVIHPLDYGDYGRVLVYQPKTRVDLTKEIETIPFAYDNIFDENSTNIQIYERSLRSLIQPFFRGQWSTVFAYGQTGSGKTYTMMGSNMTGINAGTARRDEKNLGLYYLAALDIFEMVQRPEYQNLSVQVSLFEIYGGKLFDLLHARKQVKCLEDRNGKVCFPGLTEHPAEDPDSLMALIEEGAANRSTGTTSRNADSSRSHAVLQLKLRKDVGRRKNVEHGRLNFIDLAGSERGADTSSSSRATRLEGAEINTSLLALKEVIRALATGGSMTHIPFRGSKLTQVLKDSFVGKNSRCCMVACISPDIGNCDQTLNTLRYADRVKERDPESGVLSPGYEQPVRLNPIQFSSEASSESEQDQLETLDRANSKDAEEVDETESSLRNAYASDADSAALDELLSTSNTSLHEAPKFVNPPSCPTESSNKHKSGQALVNAHRSVMSSMLAMVKNEMTLVNSVDADRDGLDDYLEELQHLQSTQLDLITRLRDSLHSYVNAAEGAQQGRPDHAESDADSFEDLRD